MSGRGGHPLFARLFARQAPAMDRSGGAEHRRRLLAGLRGRVIEVGAGSGLNFAHYPAEVTCVLAVEPEPYLRRLASRAAADAPAAVEVVAGVAEALPAAEAAFDAAVASLVLCSVADQRQALAEMRRVVRPGGELRFFEHVVATTPGLRRVQRAVDATLWPLLLGGCHTSRDTAAAIAAAGFTVQALDRFAFPETQIPQPSSPHILGIALRA